MTRQAWGRALLGFSIVTTVLIVAVADVFTFLSSIAGSAATYAGGVASGAWLGVRGRQGDVGGLAVTAHRRVALSPDASAGQRVTLVESERPKRSVRMPARQAGPLEGLLADDLTRTLMRADNVDPASLTTLMNSVARQRRFGKHSAVLRGLMLTGEVRARVQGDLAFRLPGRIATRAVDVGDRVEPGQVLATLDPAEQDADTAVAKAGVQSADAVLRQANKGQVEDACLCQRRHPLTQV